ncbi:MAG: HutD family protein [Pseudomonas sp.]|uniref:HutD/Ves family protein n=1 Tax=Pseudomonas sp. TaxID=306 RepID=UPI002734A8EF|nr:HutD family protein [Pseudomonas sp.]MDP3847831.1 HutD family protein [Pseudomonas sp.]
MAIRLIDRATARQMPWKNGAGLTIELAIAPADADLSNFQWRISSAQVADSGEFSRFAGIDRSLALLAGAGLRLQGAQTAPLLVTVQAPVAVFTGEQAISAELLAGPITDLNIMTRRADWTHSLQQLHLLGRQRLNNTADALFIYCHSGGPLNCQLADGQQQALSPGQGLLLEDQANLPALELQANTPTSVFLAWLNRVNTQPQTAQPPRQSLGKPGSHALAEVNAKKNQKNGPR